MIKNIQGEGKLHGFVINYRNPVQTTSGVNHILEHLVLSSTDIYGKKLYSKVFETHPTAFFNGKTSSLTTDFCYFSSSADSVVEVYNNIVDSIHNFEIDHKLYSSEIFGLSKNNALIGAVYDELKDTLSNAYLRPLLVYCDQGFPSNLQDPGGDICRLLNVDSSHLFDTFKATYCNGPSNALGIGQFKFLECDSINRSCNIPSKPLDEYPQFITKHWQGEYDIYVKGFTISLASSTPYQSYFTESVVVDILNKYYLSNIISAYKVYNHVDKLYCILLSNSLEDISRLELTFETNILSQLSTFSKSFGKRTIKQSIYPLICNSKLRYFDFQHLCFLNAPDVSLYTISNEVSRGIKFDFSPLPMAFTRLKSYNNKIKEYFYSGIEKVIGAQFTQATHDCFSFTAKKMNINKKISSSWDILGLDTETKGRVQVFFYTDYIKETAVKAVNCIKREKIHIANGVIEFLLLLEKEDKFEALNHVRSEVDSRSGPYTQSFIHLTDKRETTNTVHKIYDSKSNDCTAFSLFSDAPSKCIFFTTNSNIVEEIKFNNKLDLTIPQLAYGVALFTVILERKLRSSGYMYDFHAWFDFYSNNVCIVSDSTDLMLRISDEDLLLEDGDIHAAKIEVMNNLNNLRSSGGKYWKSAFDNIFSISSKTILLEINSIKNHNYHLIAFYNELKMHI